MESQITCFNYLGTTQSTSVSSPVTGQASTTGSSSAPETSTGSQGTPSSSESTTQGDQGTLSSTLESSSSASPGTTTIKFCDEMEYINTLIATNSVQTKPTNIPNKEDLITNGVDFSDKQPIFLINIPKNGAIVRDVNIFSSNVAEIE